jgi:uncharacterized membrane protein YkoI
MRVVRELSGCSLQSLQAMRTSRQTGSLVLATGLLLFGAGTGLADDDDHDLARRALEEGRALPLAEILAKMKPDLPGKVIEVVVEIDDGNLVYDLKVLSAEGRLQEIEVDAATGKILKMEDDD